MRGDDSSLEGRGAVQTDAHAFTAPENLTGHRTDEPRLIESISEKIVFDRSIDLTLKKNEKIRTDKPLKETFKTLVDVSLFNMLKGKSES